MKNQAMTVSGSEAQVAIVGHKYDGGKFCDFMSYFDGVKPMLNTLEYVNRDIYFAALAKLGLIVRGRRVKGTLIVDKKGSWYPPVDVVEAFSEDETLKKYSVYRRKASSGGLGFNCRDDSLLTELVGEPVSELLNRFSDEMSVEMEKLEAFKELAKEQGFPMSYVDVNGTQEKVINKYLGV
jgi:hypothetical protein